MLFVPAFVILLSRNFHFIFKRGLESFQLNYSLWNYCIIIMSMLAELHQINRFVSVSNNWFAHEKFANSILWTVSFTFVFYYYLEQI